MSEYIALLPFTFVATHCYTDPLRLHLPGELIYTIIIPFCNDAAIICKDVDKVCRERYWPVDCYICRRDREDIQLCMYVGSTCKKCSLILCFQCYEDEMAIHDYDKYQDAFQSFIDSTWTCLLCLRTKEPRFPSPSYYNKS